MAGQRGDRHRVVPRIRSPGYVGVRVDPQHGQVVAVTGGELGERGHADRALAAQRDDPGRPVPADDLQCGAELFDHNTLRLDPVHLLQAPVAELDRHPRRRSGVLRQDRFEHCRPDRVPAAGHSKGNSEARLRTLLTPALATAATATAAWARRPQ